MAKSPKLPDISGSKLIKVLEKDGFHKVRQKGSHVILEKKTPTKTLKTVVPLHDSLFKGLISEILRQTGLSRDRLLELLD